MLVKPKGKRGLGFSADVIPICLEYLAASIENTVDDIHIIDMEFENHSFQRLLERFHPDLVGVTMSATDHREGLRLARIAKENNASTVLGGYHPSAIPDELLSHSQVDMIVRGEGELTIRELVQQGSPEDILGVSYKKNGQITHNEDRPLVANLDSLPFPSRRLRRYEYKIHLGNHGRELDVISMSRGCWGRCSFCCEPMMSKSLQRFRSPENVMEELLEVASFHKGRPLRVFVTDPNFMGDPEKIDHLCDLLQRHKLNLSLSVMTRVDTIVRHPELVEKMCDNGIIDYELGFESSNQRDLNGTKKCMTVAMQKKAVKILRDNGVTVSGTFVIGLPGQTEQEIKQFPVYAKEIGVMNCAFGVATPFPGTEFYNILDEKSLIVERDWNKYDEMHSVFRLDGLSRKRLEELETYCMARFWTLNTLLDNLRVLQKRSGKKLSLRDFVKGIVAKVEFGRDASSDLMKEGFDGHLKTVLEAMADAQPNEEQIEMDIGGLVEISRFLDILGAQKMQFTINYEQLTPISYVIKTTKSSKSSVKYIRMISGKEEDATISVDIDLNDLMTTVNDDLSLNPMRTCVFLLKSARSIKGIWNTIRLVTASAIELGHTYLIKINKQEMLSPPLRKKAFFKYASYRHQ
jgi:radical SAM superfamily enzyme YgiQ (UPF0313 family)